MNTKIRRDYGSIANDARRVYAAALEDQDVAAFKKRLPARTLDQLMENINALERGDGESSSLLHAQVTARETAAAARTALAAALVNVRDDAKIAFGKNAPLVRGFGVGKNVHVESSQRVRRVATLVLATAAQNTKEAAAVGLDGPGLKRLKGLVAAQDDADGEHAAAVTNRHAAATTTRAAAAAVSAEVARVRLAARRVFRKDPAKLDRYAVVLPRHTPKARDIAPVDPPAPHPVDPPIPAPVPAPGARRLAS